MSGTSNMSEPWQKGGKTAIEGAFAALYSAAALMVFELYDNLSKNVENGQI